jgi:uncharacterized protein
MSARLLAASGAVFMALLTATGCVLARPALRSAGEPPVTLGAVAVEFASKSGSVIHAWLMRGEPGRGAVLLLHGVGENRNAMLGRATFLHKAGFTVLAPDFQAHGESPGEHITFGALESRDAEAAMDYLHARDPDDRVGVIGVSMGGAAAILGSAANQTDAVVLESVYPTFRDAVADRLETWLGPLGFLGSPLAPALIGMVGPSIGVSEEQLRPIDRIACSNAPLLLIAGTADSYTPLSESRALFARAGGSKEFWAVEGAGHEDLHAYAKTEYEQRVGSFFAAHLSIVPAAEFAQRAALSDSACAGPHAQQPGTP